MTDEEMAQVLTYVSEQATIHADAWLRHRLRRMYALLVAVLLSEIVFVALLARALYT